MFATQLPKFDDTFPPRPWIPVREFLGRVYDQDRKEGRRVGGLGVEAQRRYCISFGATLAPTAGSLRGSCGGGVVEDTPGQRVVKGAHSPLSRVRKPIAVGCM